MNYLCSSFRPALSPFLFVGDREDLLVLEVLTCHTTTLFGGAFFFAAAKDCGADSSKCEASNCTEKR